jgi:hypothetical protein
MWDIFDKAAHQSSLFLGEILISEAKRKEDAVRSGGTVFFRKEYRHDNEKWEIPSVILVRFEE